MQSEKASKSAPVHAVVARLANDRGETYFCKVQTMFPADFVRGLWVSIDEYANAHDDDYFMGELTDRMRAFRTTVSRRFDRGWDVCIRTHALSPAGDKRELHADVLRYLRGQGLSV